MVNKKRIDLKGHYYHIMCRGQRKNPLFFSNEDKDHYLELLKQALKRFDFDLLAYCIMRNHIHLMVFRNEDSLGEIFQWLNMKYALYFNRKYGTTGYVFQGRFLSKIITDEKYLYTVLNYIHMNPYVSGIVKEGEEFKYSSEGYYKDQVKQSIITKKLKMYSQKEYRDLGLEENNEYIGKEEQYLELEKRTERNYKKKFVERRKHYPDIQKTIKNLIRDSGLKFKDIISRKNTGKIKEKRMYIISELYYKYNFSLSEIARVLNRSKSGIHYIVKKFSNDSNTRGKK